MGRQWNGSTHAPPPSRRRVKNDRDDQIKYDSDTIQSIRML